jgi:hypothetical protein
MFRFCTKKIYFFFNNQPDALINQIKSSSILTVFGNVHKKPAWNLPVPNVQ